MSGNDQRDSCPGGKAVLILAGFLMAGTMADAQTRHYVFDPEESVLEVHVPRAGLLSSIGHDHLIRAGTLSGHVDFEDGSPAGSALVLEVPASALAVSDPEVKEKTRGKIESEMRGPDVLAEKSYPVIRFKAESIVPNASGQWEVTGFLQLRGRSRQVEFLAGVSYPTKDRLLAEGALNLEPEVFGIEPVSALGGMVRTADTIEIRFRISALLQTN